MRSIHTSTLTIYLSVYVCIYSCVCIYAERYRQKDISKGQRYQRNSRNHVRNTRDMNKSNTILYFCYWTFCFAVTSV